MSHGLAPRDPYPGLHSRQPRPPSFIRLVLMLIVVLYCIWYLSRMT